MSKTSDTLLDDLKKTKKALGDFAPRIGLLLKTGIGEELHGAIKIRKRLPCAGIAGFPAAFAENEILLAESFGQKLLIMEGGPSHHQGVSMRDLAFPLWALGQSGAEIAILTGAAGALDARFRPGGLLLVEDHLNFMGSNPLIGIPQEALGPLFPDLSKTYDRALAMLALRQARAEGIPLKRGTIASSTGPALDTDAEKRFFRNAGAQAVVTSFVPEAIGAAHAGLRTLALAAITDSCWPRAKASMSIEAMIAAAEEAAPRLERLLVCVLEALGR